MLYSSSSPSVMTLSLLDSPPTPKPHGRAQYCLLAAAAGLVTLLTFLSVTRDGPSAIFLPSSSALSQPLRVHRTVVTDHLHPFSSEREKRSAAAPHVPPAPGAPPTPDTRAPEAAASLHTPPIWLVLAAAGAAAGAAVLWSHWGYQELKPCNPQAATVAMAMVSESNGQLSVDTGTAPGSEVMQCYACKCVLCKGFHRGKGNGFRLLRRKALDC